MGLPKFWVNTASLSVVVSDTDLAYTGRGPAIAMTRTYNSNSYIYYPVDPQYGMFGNGWSFAYQESIIETCMGAGISKGAGNTLFFSANLCPKIAPTITQPPEGNFDSLVLNSGYWLYENKVTHGKYRYESVAGAQRLVSISDRNGNSVQIIHNTDGTIQKVTDASGRITTFLYDANRHCTSMTSPEGKTATYKYDANGSLIESIDLAGNKTTYSYDGNLRLSSITLGDKVTQFSYSADATTVTDALGRVQTYKRSGANETTASNASGNSSIYVANDKGKTELITDANGLSGGTSTFSGGLLTQFISPGGWAQTFNYDSRGNTLSATTTSSYGPNTTTYSYDSSDNLVSRTDPENSSWVWQYEYDANRNRTKIIRPSGLSATYSYTGGLLTSITDAKGKISTFSYDSYGNTISSSDTLGNTSTRTYDSTGVLMLSETDPAGNTTSYTYDNNHRITRITNADGTFRLFQYDCCSLIGTTDENGHSTTIGRNKLLLPVSFTDQLGNVTSYTYDENNTVISTKRPDNSVVTVTPDKLKRPSVITDALGNYRSITYDGDWNMKTMTDERGNTTSFYFDNGRPAGITGPKTEDSGYANRLTTTWDKAGRLKNWINSRFGGVTFTYTADGQIEAKRNYYPDALIASFSYDNAGNMVQMNDSWGSTYFGYDDARRNSFIYYPDTRSVTFSYASIGKLKALFYPTGVAATYTYDKRNRVKSMSFGGQTITFIYDGVGNLLSESRSNGTTSTYSYDARNHVTGISHAKGGTVFSQAVFIRDNMGNITSESGFQPIDPAISPATATAVYNAGNQIATWNSDVYTYDWDGNLTGIIGTRTWGVTYDSENRISTITRNGVTTSYTYNGRGQRVKADTGTQATLYHYDSLGRLLFQTDGANQITASFYYIGGRLVALSTPGDYYFYHYDKTGSTIALTDTKGNIATAYAYLPFGENTRVPSNGSVANPFTYVGAFGVMDDGGGIYHMSTRSFDAVSGRFMQRDPAGFIGGTNLYSYAANNPLLRVDPSGFDDEDVTNVMEGTVNLNTGELPESMNNPEDDQALYDNAQYLGDKLMNYAPEKPGTFYTLGKACFNAYKYGGTEGAARGIIELGKMAIGSYYGATYGLAADLYQDAMEGQLAYLKKRAETIPDDNPRWGKPNRFD